MSLSSLSPKLAANGALSRRWAGPENGPLTIEQLSPPHDLTQVDRCLTRLFATVGRRHGTHAHVRPWLDRMRDFVLQGGKRFRPRLCLASYRIGRRSAGPPPRGVWLAASSLELLHAFMLVHDDLIDGSALRRGLPTLHERYRANTTFTDLSRDRQRGADLALVAGDFLFAMALELLSRSGLPARELVKAQRLVSEMLLETGLGEALDVLHDDLPLADLTEGQILHAYALKTSRYSISGPLALGAMLAGAGPSVTKALSGMGDRLGMAYQIQNDLAGVLGDPATDEIDDIDGSKRTYLLWVTYRRLSESGREALDDALASPVGPDRRRRIIAMVRASGALEECRSKISRLHDEAATLLDESPLDASQRRGYLSLVATFGLQGTSLSHVSRG